MRLLFCLKQTRWGAKSQGRGLEEGATRALMRQVLFVALLFFFVFHRPSPPWVIKAVASIKPRKMSSSFGLTVGFIEKTRCVSRGAFIIRSGRKDVVGQVKGVEMMGVLVASRGARERGGRRLEVEFNSKR